MDADRSLAAVPGSQSLRLANGQSMLEFSETGSRTTNRPIHHACRHSTGELELMMRKQ